MRFSRALLLLPLFSVASLIAIACGDDPAPASPSDAGSDAPGDSAADDTGATDGGGGSDAKGDGRMPTGRGTFNVVLFSPTPQALAVGFYQSAGFDRIAPPFDAGPSRVKCTSTFLDHCYLSSCEFSTDDAGPGPQPPPFDGGTPNVGTIMVSGYAVDGGTISMPVNDAGKYTTFVDPNGGFSGGEVITYSWLGASDPSEGPVGAFTKATTAPAKIDLTKPVVSDGGIGVIRRDADWEITWTNKATQPPEAKVFVTLANDYDGVSSRALQCSPPAVLGSYKVPVALMQQMKAGLARVGVSTMVSNLVQHGEWDISIVVEALLANTDLYPGSPGTATLE